MKIFEIAGGAIDHVPPVMYEFEISSSKKVDDRENVYSRVANMPSLINLSNWTLNFVPDGYRQLFLKITSRPGQIFALRSTYFSCGQ